MITVTKTDLPLSVSANMSTVSMPEDLMDIILVSVDLDTMLYHTERNTNAVSTRTELKEFQDGVPVITGPDFSLLNATVVAIRLIS